jgi:hypothetical protein
VQNKANRICCLLTGHTTFFSVHCDCDSVIRTHAERQRVRVSWWERAMRTHIDRRHPALRHGAFSATAVLPGESRAEFEKLHRDLIAEFSPSGALEDDVVMNIAHLVWRKQNLATLRTGERARERRNAIISEKAFRVYVS